MGKIIVYISDLKDVEIVYKVEGKYFRWVIL